MVKKICGSIFEMIPYCLKFQSVAPSPPRSVRARLVSARQSLVEVSWREPAATNGIISQYTVIVRGGASASSSSGSTVANPIETFNRV